MTTLILDSNSKKDVSLLLDIAKKIGLDLKIAAKTDVDSSVTAPKPKVSKQKAIMELSKEVNKNLTQRLLKMHNIPFDSNNGQ